MAKQITARYINRQLRQRGSPLVGEGQTFIDVAAKYDLDPLLLVSIAGAESEYGKKIKPGTFNPFGWGPHIPFGSWGEAIQTVGKGLRTGYLDEGLTSIPEIGQKWAPIGAGNDPTNLNSNWAGNVQRIYGQLGGPTTGATVPRPPVPSAPPARQPTAPANNALLADIFRQNQELIGVEPIDLGALIPNRRAKPVAQAGPIPIVQETRGKPTKAIRDFSELVEHYLGTPYSWGGGSPAGPSKGFGRGANTVGFDCSSFLQFLWAKQGVEIPRVTYAQWKTGTPVPKGKLREGDAVFFRMEASGPGHVGVYLGSGQFAHAPKTGDVVKISRLNDSYYRRNYVGARRFG